MIVSVFRNRVLLINANEYLTFVDMREYIKFQFFIYITLESERNLLFRFYSTLWQSKSRIFRIAQSLSFTNWNWRDENLVGFDLLTFHNLTKWMESHSLKSIPVYYKNPIPIPWSHELGRTLCLHYKSMLPACKNHFIHVIYTQFLVGTNCMRLGVGGDYEWIAKYFMIVYYERPHSDLFCRSVESWKYLLCFVVVSFCWSFVNGRKEIKGCQMLEPFMHRATVHSTSPDTYISKSPT